MKNSKVLNKLGKSIEYYVGKSDKSLNLIAIHAGIGASTRLKMIMDGNVNVTIETLYNLAVSLDVTVAEIIDKMEEF